MYYKQAAPTELKSPIKQASPFKSTTLTVRAVCSDMYEGCVNALKDALGSHILINEHSKHLIYQSGIDLGMGIN